MNNYAYIPLQAYLQNGLPNEEAYIVRIPKYLEGLLPDVLDSNGNGIPNAFELEGTFTDTQKSDITALGGLHFSDSTTYAQHLNELKNG